MYGRRFGAKYGNTRVSVDGMPFDSNARPRGGRNFGCWSGPER